MPVESGTGLFQWIRDRKMQRAMKLRPKGINTHTTAGKGKEMQP